MAGGGVQEVGGWGEGAVDESIKDGQIVWTDFQRRAFYRWAIIMYTGWLIRGHLNFSISGRVPVTAFLSMRWRALKVQILKKNKSEET